jgi:peptide/nickel transport system permease protein
MAIYITRRVIFMLVTLAGISIISFVIIQLPPGDWLSTYVAELESQGVIVNREELTALKERYGLGDPVYVQYFKWISNIILRNDWGMSLEMKMPVKELIWERLGLTMVLSLMTMLFSWTVSIGVGVYSATHQYTIPDYVLNLLSFIGAGTPEFMLALVVMWLAFTKLGLNVGGLFSPDMIAAPWGWAKVVDLLKHIWIPILVLAVGSTAGGIRTNRANLLDELHRPYVQTARAKGLAERKLLWKYPVRLALNPFFSTVGWSLAGLVSGTTLVSLVLSLQTTGPLLLKALLAQDMYLAGSFLLMLSVLTVIGTLISDIVLAVVDPRIRLQE